VVIALLLVSFFAGVFDTVKLSTETAGPYNLIYREFQGPFSGIRFTLNDVFKYVRDKKKSRPAEVLGSSMMIRQNSFGQSQKHHRGDS
jgi:hypothetical protein